MEKKYLSVKEQIELFKKRGMIFKDEEMAIKKCLLRLYNKDNNIITQIGFKNLDDIRELKI